MGESLNPTLLSRISHALRPDFARTVMARRVAAGFLVVLAAVIALRPDPDHEQRDVVVAARDLSPGVTLTADDVALRKRPACTIPDGAANAVDAVVGATLAGPSRRGEVLTDARVLGSRLAGLSAGPDARVVPLHLADAAVLDLIRPGDVVDVLGGGVRRRRGRTRGLVATNAVVVLVSARTDGSRGRRRSGGPGRPARAGRQCSGRRHAGTDRDADHPLTPDFETGAGKRLCARLSHAKANFSKERLTVLKGFKEFLARGNIVDLSVAVVIGTAFTALVTKFTDSIIQPLINRIGAGKDAEYGILQIDIGGGQTIDLNVLLSAFINFVLVAAVVYFLVVLPYNKLRNKGEVESADDTEMRLLTEIRDAVGGKRHRHPSPNRRSTSELKK